MKTTEIRRVQRAHAIVLHTETYEVSEEEWAERIKAGDSELEALDHLIENSITIGYQGTEIEEVEIIQVHETWIDEI